MRRFFFSGTQLRAIWGILLFLLIVVSLRFAQYFAFTRQLSPQALMGPFGMLAEEAIRAAIVIFATWVLARVEGRNWLVYGLGGSCRLKLLVSGAAMGFLTLSVLVAVLMLGGHATLVAEQLSVLQILYAGVTWLLAFLAVALFEELLLRGYLQYTLARGIGFWWAALVWSAVFTWMHMGNGGESTLGLLQTGWMALFFCLSLRVTGSLWWAIGFHALWDWAESFFYGTPNSGLRFSQRLLTETAHGDALWSGGSTGPEGSLFSLFVLVVPLLWLLLKWRRRA
ncbi:CPBP family intramembrane glutamic endopeptidase [Dyella acidiphila]|uniref:CPBP family intramembrane metalloprotease n=1 Tax=Dyella acidiphila TaxID=2775866 RepID=A0ABR9GEL5_9GAMM|nr:type II CAAX endopeptidase family protein [Dyella acidiphila]MBE1162429.1 CPBP family intramembrane metalloprotease [Dyella acidiphila]